MYFRVSTVVYQPNNCLGEPAQQVSIYRCVAEKQALAQVLTQPANASQHLCPPVRFDSWVGGS